MATKQPKTKAQKTTMTLLPGDLEVIENLRDRFGLKGMLNSEVVRIALRRLLEEKKAA